jgi:hypothetical protein
VELGGLEGGVLDVDVAPSVEAVAEPLVLAVVLGVDVVPSVEVVPELWVLEGALDAGVVSLVDAVPEPLVSVVVSGLLYRLLDFLLGALLSHVSCGGQIPEKCLAPRLSRQLYVESAWPTVLKTKNRPTKIAVRLSICSPKVVAIR